MHDFVFIRMEELEVCSINLDFADFIDSVKYRDIKVILSLAELEAKEAERISEIMGIGDEYANAIFGLIYFLKYSQRPGGIKEEYLELYHDVCQNLIEKEQLSPEILQLLEPLQTCPDCIETFK